MKRVLLLLLLFGQSCLLQAAFPNNMKDMLNYDARCSWIVYAIKWEKQKLIKEVGYNLQEYNKRFSEVDDLKNQIALPLIFDIYIFKFAEYLFKCNYFSFEQDELLKKALRIDQVSDVIEQFMKDKDFPLADKHKFMALAANIVFADIFARIKK